MKKSIKVLLIFTLGTIFGVSLLITYASTYNSEEISYDNSNSHAEAENVKDAIDYLYSHGFSTCPEDMTCIESPVVTINSSGPGNVDKSSIHVRINGSNKFIVTPDEGFTLNSITCDNGYTLGTFNISNNSTLEEASAVQEITITNPGISEGATCNVYFGSYDISIKTSGSYDTCNSSGVGCVCWYIFNYVTGAYDGYTSGTRGQKFNYDGHTDCNFKSYLCSHDYGNPLEARLCGYLIWYPNENYWRANGDGRLPHVYCEGVITCAT